MNYRLNYRPWKRGIHCVRWILFLSCFTEPAFACWTPLRASAPEVTRFWFSVNKARDLVVHDSKWDNTTVLVLKPQRALWGSPTFVFEESLRLAEEERVKRFSKNSGHVNLWKKVANKIFEEQPRARERALMEQCYIGADLKRIFFLTADGYFVFEGERKITERIYIEWPAEMKVPRRNIRLALGEHLRHFYDRDPRTGR